MSDLDSFCHYLANDEFTEVDRAVALIWYSTEVLDSEDCTTTEIIQILHDHEFAKPNFSRLQLKLKSSPFTVTGNRKGSLRISRTKLAFLDEKYRPHVKTKRKIQSDFIIPSSWVKGTRTYLENMVTQINGSYELGYYDAAAVLVRRLMESLIIETYIFNSKDALIRNSNRSFFSLEDLIKKVKADFDLGKNTLKYMDKIKEIGDRAAHDRTYCTDERDFDPTHIRTTIDRLLILSNIKK